MSEHPKLKATFAVIAVWMFAAFVILSVSAPDEFFGVIGDFFVWTDTFMPWIWIARVVFVVGFGGYLILTTVWLWQGFYRDFKHGYDEQRMKDLEGDPDLELARRLVEDP